MEQRSKKFNTAAIITFIIIISKIVGFVRDMVLAAYFGQGIETDAYITSYGIISIFTILFGAAIASTFIPAYTRTRLANGHDKANDYASSILNLYILCAILVGVLGYIFAPQICGLIWRGDDETLVLITRLSRYMFPSLVFWTVTGVLVNILNAHKNFIPEQLIGFVLSFCVILACVVWVNIDAVAIATTVAAGLQILVLLPFMRKKFRWKRKMEVQNKQVQRTFVLALPALISAAFDELNHQADRFFGSAMGSGVVSALGRSYSIVQALMGVLIIPITTIMFPELSRYAALKEMDQFKATMRKALEIIVLMTLPVIAICIVTSKDIISIFYQRGNFTAADTEATAAVFSMYVLGIAAFGIRIFLARAYFSLQLNRIPMILGIISVGINIVLDIILKDILGAPGLTLATSIASSCGALMLFFVLRKKLGNMPMRRGMVQIVKILIAAGCCFFIAQIVHYYMSMAMPEDILISQLLRLVVSGFVAFAVYMLVAFLLKIESAKRLIGMVKRKVRAH